jgi:spore coat protein U-like protein
MINLNCENVPWVDLKLGVSSTSGTFNPRRMKRSGGSDVLEYNIFIDATRTVIFGDGTGGTQTIRVHKPPGTPAKAPWSSQVTIYARIPPGQDVPAGGYSDSLTITVDW